MTFFPGASVKRNTKSSSPSSPNHRLVIGHLQVFRCQPWSWCIIFILMKMWENCPVGLLLKAHVPFFELTGDSMLSTERRRENIALAGD